MSNCQEILKSILSICDNKLTSSRWTTENNRVINIDRKLNGDILFASSSNSSDTYFVVINREDTINLSKAAKLCKDLITTFTLAHSYCIDSLNYISDFYGINEKNQGKEELYKMLVEYFYEMASARCKYNITIDFAMQMVLKEFQNVENSLVTIE